MTSGMEMLVNMLLAGVAVIDGLPVYIRAFFAGLLLATVLRRFESRISDDEVLYSVSFRKSAFVALLLIPLLVWLFPDSRMVVYVDELPPRSTSIPWGWLLVLAVWVCGAVVCCYQLVSIYLQAYRKLSGYPAVAADHKLNQRLQHWQQQLGIAKPLILVVGNTLDPQYLPASQRIIFPPAALHWPVGTQDVLLIRQLCLLQKNHHLWHCFAQLVECCYWPVTWLTSMHRRMNTVFQLEADSLAEACYRDRLGYERALRQLAQQFPPAQPSAVVKLTGQNRFNTLVAAIHRYRTALLPLWLPTPSPPLDFSQLFAARMNRDQQRNAEPYDKVFWFVGQAVLLSLLISGPTLQQTPPEFEEEFNLPFEFFWLENSHRNQERLEQNPTQEEIDQQNSRRPDRPGQPQRNLLSTER